MSSKKISHISFSFLITNQAYATFLLIFTHFLMIFNDFCDYANLFNRTLIFVYKQGHFYEYGNNYKLSYKQLMMPQTRQKCQNNTYHTSPSMVLKGI